MMSHDQGKGSVFVLQHLSIAFSKIATFAYEGPEMVVLGSDLRDVIYECGTMSFADRHLSEWCFPTSPSPTITAIPTIAYIYQPTLIPNS